MGFNFLTLFTINVILLRETWPIQWIYNQHCGYWWPGALAPGHQWPQCWLCIHMHFHGLILASFIQHIGKGRALQFMELNYYPLHLKSETRNKFFTIAVSFNTMRCEQNAWHFADDILQYIVLNDNLHILGWISLKFVPMGLTDSKIVLVK